MSSVDAGNMPRAGEDLVQGWDAELDRLFVGLRRTVGVSHGPGTQALLDSSDGRRLIEAEVIVNDHLRLRVSKPLFTDAVHRSVLALQPPIVSGDSNA